MNFRPFSAEDATAAASAALSRAWGQPVTINMAENLGNETRRNLILRACATSDGIAPRSVIIKATRSASYDRNATDGYATSGFVKEWAAASYLVRYGALQRFTPALIAYDLDRGVLVYDDVGASVPSLVGPLLHGTAAEAEQALTGYAEALAELHRTTIGSRSGHAAILREGFPSLAIPPPAHRWLEDVTRSLNDLLGDGPPGDETAQVAARLRQPGQWQVLVHGDPCPDNILLGGDGRAILLDLEFARPGHALLDAAYWRMGFPTCWCAGTVPTDAMHRVDRAYRAAMRPADPVAADDDAFRRESAYIDMAWLLGNMAWLLKGALAEDGTWGRAPNRSRILTYLQRAVQSTEEAGILPRLRAWATVQQGDLRSRWPDAIPLSDFPAFTGAAAGSSTSRSNTVGGRQWSGAS